MADPSASYPYTPLADAVLEKLRLLGEVEALTQLIYGARMQAGSTARITLARLAALESYTELMGKALRHLQTSEMLNADVEGKR